MIVKLKVPISVGTFFIIKSIYLIVHITMKYDNIAADLLIDLYITQNLSKPEIKTILNIPLTSLNTLLKKRGIVKSKELLKQMQSRIVHQTNQKQTPDKKLQKSINCKKAWYNRTEQQKEQWLIKMHNINSHRTASHQDKLNKSQQKTREIETDTHKKQRLHNISIGTKLGMKNMSAVAKQERNIKAAESIKKAWNKKSNQDKQNIVNKIFSTKRNKHTLSTSKQEDQAYFQLCTMGLTILRNYKSILYPFHCDFYIKELDLYIELNYHWTHGARLFDPNNKSCLAQLDTWKERAKSSKYYKQAIEVWTKRDINKFKIANKNKLNYLVFYSVCDFNIWLSKLVKVA